MKIAISYFYQIRFFKPWMIPVSIFGQNILNIKNKFLYINETKMVSNI